jgi:hypothetical protein
MPGRATAAAALRRMLQPRFLALLGTGFLLAAVAVGALGHLRAHWPWQGPPGAGGPAVTTAAPDTGSQPQAQPDAFGGSTESARDQAPPPGRATEEPR